MNVDFEPVMAALFARLEAAATLTFTADATEGSAVLENVSALDGLFVGLPVFGPGVANLAVIAALDPNAATVTLSEPATDDSTAADFATGFQKTGRRAQHWSQVSGQPAMFFRRIGTTDVLDGYFTVTTLEGEVWIYSKAGEDPDAIPDVALSNLDRMIRSSFAPDAEYGDPRCTLGGMVHWARIEGRSDYSPGDLGGQGISRIPVRITLP